MVAIRPPDWEGHRVADKCVLDMKSAALKILAVVGVAVAVYPVVTNLRPDRSNSAQLQSNSGAETETPSNSKSPKQPETALSLYPAQPIYQNGSSSVLIRPDSSGHFVTKAIINNIEIAVMFDTGASIMALSYEDATKLGLRLGAKDFRSQIQTANGLTQAAEVTLAEIRIDTISIRNVAALVLPPGKLQTSLLGRSFWGRLQTGFSYASGNLILKN